MQALPAHVLSTREATLVKFKDQRCVCVIEKKGGGEGGEKRVGEGGAILDL